jgi:hypothetical protein
MPQIFPTEQHLGMGDFKKRKKTVILLTSIEGAKTLRTMTLRTMTLSVMTLSITTLSMRGLFCDTQHV